MDKLRKIYDMYIAKRKDMEISVDTIKKELGRYKDKIVLYGAGSAGIAFCNYLKDVGITVNYFSDGDKKKQGKTYLGLKILAPDEIKDIAGEDALVIVTINTDGKSYCKDFKEALLKNGHKGVHRTLKECGCKNVIDYTYFRRCYGLFEGEKYNLPSCNDIHLMENNWNKIEQVYKWLEDEVSRETFAKIVEFRMVDDSADIPTFSEKDMYFEYDFFEKRNDEILIDCGACSGSSLRDFLRINGCDFEKCISIEPDSKNYKGLIEYISTLDEIVKNKIEPVFGAVYSHNGTAGFYELSGPGTFAAEDGPNKIKTLTIDSLLKGEKATYIKMNIEGSEVYALDGAAETIKKYKPRMAIMGYHKTSDLWDVPYIIKKLRPDYSLHLRSYMHNIAFAYYAH